MVPGSHSLDSFLTTQLGNVFFTPLSFSFWLVWVSYPFPIMVTIYSHSSSCCAPGYKPLVRCSLQGQFCGIQIHAGLLPTFTSLFISLPMVKDMDFSHLPLSSSQSLLFLSKVQPKSLFLATSPLGPGSPAANRDSSCSVDIAPSADARV